MSRLTQELTDEHEAIITKLNDIKRAGISSVDGQKKLQMIKFSLLAHLQKEDTLLYPRLEKEAKSNDSLQRTLDMFASDMEAITHIAMNFFDKYSSGGSGEQFAREFGQLFATLSIRIKKEEKIIYAKYDEIT